MIATSYALRPGRFERALRAAVLVYVILLVAVPLAALFAFGLASGLDRFWERIAGPVALSALWLTLWTGVLVAMLNLALGTATAWVLVRYRFPGRSVLSGAVDLPLAIPTLVAGIMIAVFYGPASLVGESLAVLGLEIVYAQPGIVVALLFITLPFVVRAVAPVLAEIDPAEEEAAIILGASPWRTFRTVYLPSITPAAFSGAIRSMARAIGEFGSIVVVSGNIPLDTLTAPVFIFGEIESGADRVAAAVSAVLLVFALAVHGGARLLERRIRGRHAAA